MSPMPTINLKRPIARAKVMDDDRQAAAVATGSPTRTKALGAPMLVSSSGCVERDGGRPTSDVTSRATATDKRSDLPSDDPGQEVQQQRDGLARLLATVQRLADSLGRVYEETMACHRGEIARLAVEIARKILMYKVDKGDYAIQAIVEEALKQAPARQKIVVRLHPEDLAECQRLQKEDPQGPFAQLELAADGDLGRGECFVQTPKGTVTSLLEEHLERIREALQKIDN
jgi:hypothetical protein